MLHNSPTRVSLTLYLCLLPQTPDSTLNVPSSCLSLVLFHWVCPHNLPLSRRFYTSGSAFAIEANNQPLLALRFGTSVFAGDPTETITMVLCIMPNDKAWVKGIGFLNGPVLIE